MEKQVYKIYEETTKMLEKHINKNEGLTPVPIEKIAEDLGLSITISNLNFANNRKFNQRVAETVDKTIIIDKNTEYKLGRYAIAYEIGKYLQTQSKDGDAPQYSLPYLPSTKESIIAEIYAIFLTIPIESLFLEFRDYIENMEEYPDNIEEWWRIISKKSEVPLDKVASSYTYIKLAAIEYYKQKVEGKTIQDQYIHFGDIFM